MLEENDVVRDDELLYRAVQHGKGRVENINGKLRPTKDCFLDPSYKVSVDRAAKCGHNPAYTQRHSSDYICCLRAAQVRAIQTVVRQNIDGSQSQPYLVDVRPDAIPENPAHALIFADPQIESDKVFRRMKAALVLLAAWEPNFAPDEAN